PPGRSWAGSITAVRAAVAPLAFAMLVLFPTSSGAVERTPLAPLSSGAVEPAASDAPALARKRRPAKKRRAQKKEAPPPAPVVVETVEVPAFVPPPPALAVVPLRVDGLQLNDVARLNQALREQVARVSPHALQAEARTTELYEAAKGLGLACDINQVD